MKKITSQGVSTKILLAILSAIFLTGCHCGNFQEYEKGNILASGFNSLGWGQCHYQTLDIGSATQPIFETGPQFIVIFPNGEVLKSTEITPDNSDTSKRINDEKYPNELHIWFIFRGSKLARFHYSCDSSFPDENKINVKIGSIDGSKLYEIPLRDWQLRELFGEPDQTSASWIW